MEHDPTLSAISSLLGLLGLFENPAKARELMAEFERQYTHAAKKIREEAAALAEKAERDRAAAEQAHADAETKLAEAKALAADVEQARADLKAREDALAEREVAVSRDLSTIRWHEQKAAEHRQNAEAAEAAAREQKKKTAELLGVDLNAA